MSRKKVVMVLLLLMIVLFSLPAADNTGDSSKERKMGPPGYGDREKNEAPENKRPSSGQSMASIEVSDSMELNVNNKADLMFNSPDDMLYPINYLSVRAQYMVPVAKSIGLGPVLVNENTQQLIHFNDASHDGSVEVVFQSIFNPGIGLNIMPLHKKLNVPLLIFTLGVGPSVQINNDLEDDDGLKVKFGGFSTQFLMLPLVPFHLMISDLNIVSILARSTPTGWKPGIMVKNTFNLRFAFFNFINKKINSGLLINNRFRYIQTGRPSMTDLTYQYTYNRLETTLFFGGVPGLEIHLGYGFEYITFARDSDYYTAHKMVTGVSWERMGFKVDFRYILAFWDENFENGQPVNHFNLKFSYKLANTPGKK